VSVATAHNSHSNEIRRESNTAWCEYGLGTQEDARRGTQRGGRSHSHRASNSNVMGTIPSPLFSHGKHDGCGCSKFGSLTPLSGSALHDGVENSLCAGCHAMISQTVGKCANESVDSELVAIAPGIGTLSWKVPCGVATDALEGRWWSVRGDIAGERLVSGSEGTLLRGVS